MQEVHSKKSQLFFFSFLSLSMYKIDASETKVMEIMSDSDKEA